MIHPIVFPPRSRLGLNGKQPRRNGVRQRRGGAHEDARAIYTGFKMRTPWLEKRSSDAIRTQMHYARKGLITEEMEYIARIEKISAELIRTEVARGRMIIPANIRHTNLEPMAIGVESKCKINSNIGNSAVTSNIDEELEKLQYSVKYGADTVMDLSTGGDIPRIRQAI